ncbi:hypothetical protein NAPIS_ORF01222 [Vairimorpha apis BRL 01]|uniref:Uncharacterized protein n=1 Tax=Vairimorpha apis BRL 01 TaxID=1037528 RepID=T0MDB2_9MICR|nr:hypothetical protein NAPIS_ORF01222 [Vairimorpha apis BRL 01]
MKTNNTTIKTYVNISYNKPDLFLIDKIKKELLIVEKGVISLDNLQQDESEKLRNYDEFSNELVLIHGFKTKNIPYVKRGTELGITDQIEAYIQFTALKKTLESISIEYRRGGRITETKETDQQTIVFPRIDTSVNKLYYKK